MDNPSSPGGSPPPAPTITPADIEAQIASEHYFTAADGAIESSTRSIPCPAPAISLEHLGRMTFCVLVLRNGFVVSGESAPVCPENFDATEGRNAARAAAISKCWPLLGFRLRDEIARS